MQLHAVVQQGVVIVEQLHQLVVVAVGIRSAVQSHKLVVGDPVIVQVGPRAVGTEIPTPKQVAVAGIIFGHAVSVFQRDVVFLVFLVRASVGLVQHDAAVRVLHAQSSVVPKVAQGIHVGVVAEVVGPSAYLNGETTHILQADALRGLCVDRLLNALCGAELIDGLHDIGFEAVAVGWGIDAVQIQVIGVRAKPDQRAADVLSVTG